MIIKKEKVNTDTDLSICSLECAISLFKDKFNFSPNYVHVSVSIENVFIPLLMMLILYKENSQIKVLDIPVYFQVNREFEEHHWEVQSFKNGISYIIYPEGA